MAALMFVFMFLQLSFSVVDFVVFCLLFVSFYF